jgi:hypothetical protein
MEKLKHIPLELRIQKAYYIINIVNRYFDVDCNQEGRKSYVLIPRQMAMYYIRKNIKLSFYQIGKLFKGKNHATVIHACRTMENLIEVDSEIRGYDKDLSDKCADLSKLNNDDLDKYRLIDTISNRLNSLDIDTLTKVEKYLNVY